MRVGEGGGEEEDEEGKEKACSGAWAL